MKISIKFPRKLNEAGEFFMYVTYSRQEIEINRKSYEMMYDASHHLVKMDPVMDWDFVSKRLEVFLSTLYWSTNEVSDCFGKNLIDSIFGRLSFGSLLRVNK